MPLNANLDQILPHVLPLLSSRDVIEAAQSHEDLKKKLGSLNLVNLRIDNRTLEQFPLLTNPNRDIYKSIAETVTELTLNKVREEDVVQIFSIFLRVRSLRLEEVVLAAPHLKYPCGLEKLAVIDCQLNLAMMSSWLYKARKSLTIIELSGSRWINLENTGWGLKAEHFPYRIRRMVVVADNCRGILRGPHLVSLSWNVKCYERRGFIRRLECTRTLKTLIIDEILPTEIMFLERFSKLQHLHILSSIHPYVKSRLESMKKWKTLNVHCYDVIPELSCSWVSRLNDDCWLKVLSFLSLADLMSLEKMHARFNQLVDEYMYARTEIKIDDRFLNDHKLETSDRLYRQIGGKGRTLQLFTKQWKEILPYFTNLDSLSIWANGDFNLIPSGLKTLKLHSYDESLKDLFLRLDDSLTFLCLENVHDANLDSLSELHNLRQFEMHCTQTRNIAGFLFRNGQKLERLHFSREYTDQDYVPRRGGTRKQGDSFELCPLKSLKVLQLHGMDLVSNRSHFILRPCDFPSLEEIELSFATRSEVVITRIIEMVLTFDHVQKLHINSPIQWDIRRLSSFKNLRSWQYDTSRFKTDEDLLVQVIKELPQLVHLKGFEDVSLDFKAKLKQALVEHKRSIVFYDHLGRAMKIN